MGFALTAILSIPALAVPLTEELVRSSKRIVLMSGTFDPVTLGHIDLAERALEEWGADLAIVLPNPHPINKSPLSIRKRNEILHSALEHHPKIAYGYSGVLRELTEGMSLLNSNFVRELKRLNPDLETAIVIGDDVTQRSYTRLTFEASLRPDAILVSPRVSEEDLRTWAWTGTKVQILRQKPREISSTSVRRILRENFDLYFLPKEERVRHTAYAQLLQQLPAAELDKILDDGLYLNQRIGGKVPPYHRLKIWVRAMILRTLQRLNLAEAYKKYRVSSRAKPNVERVQIGPSSYPVIRFLGNGMGTDAYLIEVDGRTVVAKIAKEGREKNLIESVPLQLWSGARAGILVPELIDYDPEGKWILTEFIGGPSLAKQIANEKGLSPQMRNSIRQLYDRITEVERTIEATLDFAPDNIIIRDGQPYLVDLGMIPTKLNPNFDSLVNGWESIYSKQGAQTPLRRDFANLRNGLRCESAFSPR